MIKIYNEDCLNILPLVDSESIDLIVTDPPYLMDYKTSHRKDKSHPFCKTIKNDKKNSVSKDVIKFAIKESYRVLKNNTAMYMFCNYLSVDFFKQEIEKYFQIKNMIIWVKNNHTAGDLECSFGRMYEILFLLNKGNKPFNGTRIPDVWFFDRIVGNEQLHQNEKPVKLIERCIKKHSYGGDLVLDMFMGSGTTLEACKKLNRNCIGIELNKKHCDNAEKRLKSIDSVQANLF